MSQITKTIQMFLTLGKRRWQAASFEEASRMFEAARDRLETGARDTPDCRIVDAEGKTIARISYNGRVWAGTTWKPSDAPLYDPRA